MICFKIMESFSAFNATVMNYFRLLKYLKNDQHLQQASRIFSLYESALFPEENVFVASFKPVEAFLFELLRLMVRYYRLSKQLKMWELSIKLFISCCCHKRVINLIKVDEKWNVKTIKLIKVLFVFECMGWGALMNRKTIVCC